MTMKTRKTILLVAIGVLALALALQTAFEGRTAVKTLSLAEDPDTIEIARAGGEVTTLAKDGDRWLVGAKKYPADPQAVDEMIKALKEIKTLGSVSSSGDWARYGLDDASPVVVKASRAGMAMRTVAAGKNSSTTQQSYVRVDGGKDVLLASSRFRDRFDKSAEGLRDRTVWKVPSEGMTRIESDFAAIGDIDGSGKRRAAFAVAKAGTPATWQGAPLSGKNAQAVDAAKTAGWAESLAELRADSFAPDGTAIPANALGRIAIVAAGKTLALTVARKEGETKYLCVSSESPYPFFLQKATVMKFAKGLEELR
jgi:hypothetical protein